MEGIKSIRRSMLFVILFCVAYIGILGIIKGETVENFDFREGVIYAYKGDEEVVVIPSEIEGESVTGLGSYIFDNNHNIKKVILSDTITFIGGYAFEGCTQLEEIVLSNGITEIQAGAFAECTSLEIILLPEGLIKLEDHLFYECTNLKDVMIPSTVQEIGNMTFEGCKALNQIDLPEGVVKIGMNVFSECTSLESIGIPNTIESIGSSTFYECTSLKTIQLPEGLLSIGENAFQNCLSLQEVILPTTIQRIESDTFSGCSGLRKVELPNSITEIGMQAFRGCGNLESIQLPEQLVKLGGAAFGDCQSLKSIVLPIGIRRIEGGMFRECSSLKSVVLPAQLEYIGETAFLDCTSLESVSIPYGVTQIESSAFSYCESLKELTLPITVQEFGTQTFYGCKKVERYILDYGNQDISDVNEDTLKEWLDKTEYIKMSQILEAYVKNISGIKTIKQTGSKVVNVKVIKGTQIGTVALQIEASIGNTITLQLANMPIVQPETGAKGPTGEGIILGYRNGSDIQGLDPYNKKYVGIYEISPLGNIVGFTAVELQPADFGSAESVYDKVELFNSFYNQILEGKLYVDLTNYAPNGITYADMWEFQETINSLVGKRGIYFSYNYKEGTDYIEPAISINYVDKAAVLKALGEVEQVIKPVFEQCRQVTTDIERELIIHDFIVKNSEYDYENYINGTIPSISYTAYGLLINKTAVCNGYAYATQFLLNRVGISSMIVVGMGNGQSHAWNIVTVNGQNYHLDTTFDDPISDAPNMERYDYFNVSDETLSWNHKWDVSSVPTCNDERYQFMNGMKEYIKYKNMWYYIGKLSKYIYSYNETTRDVQVVMSKKCFDMTLDKEQMVLVFKQWDMWEAEYEMKTLDIIGKDTRYFTEAFIGRFYKQCLSREADKEGLSYWSSKLLSGELMATELATYFIESQEFEGKNLSNEEYMKILYNVFFDRAVDEEGLQFWMNKLAKGVTRKYVLAGFVNSREFSEICYRYNIEQGKLELSEPVDQYPDLTQFIYRFYEKCMDRVAEQQGLGYWVEGFSKGTFTASQVARFFVLGTEFQEKQVSDEVFILTMYEVFFDRMADDEGKNYWLEKLRDGEARESILENFIYSSEFGFLCGSYNIIL